MATHSVTSGSCIVSENAKIPLACQGTCIPQQQGAIYSPAFCKADNPYVNMTQKNPNVHAQIQEHYNLSSHYGMMLTDTQQMSAAGSALAKGYLPSSITHDSSTNPLKPSDGSSVYLNVGGRTTDGNPYIQFPGGHLVEQAGVTDPCRGQSIPARGMFMSNHALPTTDSQYYLQENLQYATEGKNPTDQMLSLIKRQIELRDQMNDIHQDSEPSSCPPIPKQSLTVEELEASFLTEAKQSDQSNQSKHVSLESSQSHPESKEEAQGETGEDSRIPSQEDSHPDSEKPSCDSVPTMRMSKTKMKTTGPVNVTSELRRKNTVQGMAVTPLLEEYQMSSDYTHSSGDKNADKNPCNLEKQHQEGTTTTGSARSADPYGHVIAASLPTAFISAGVLSSHCSQNTWKVQDIRSLPVCNKPISSQIEINREMRVLNQTMGSLQDSENQRLGREINGITLNIQEIQRHVDMDHHDPPVKEDKPSDVQTD